MVRPIARIARWMGVVGRRRRSPACRLRRSRRRERRSRGGVEAGCLLLREVDMLVSSEVEGGRLRELCRRRHCTGFFEDGRVLFCDRLTLVRGFVVVG